MKNVFFKMLVVGGLVSSLLSGCQNNGVASSTTNTDSLISNSLLMSVQTELATVDSDSDAILDQEERKALFEKLRTADTMTPELKEAIISMFDLNGDREISAEEIPTRVPPKPAFENAGRMGIDNSREKTRRLFCPPSDVKIPELKTAEEFIAEYDVDGDGLLSAQELPGWMVMVNLEEGIREALLASGALNIDLEVFPESREEVLVEIDTDGDGKISQNEIDNSGILSAGLHKERKFKSEGDRGLSKKECKESCGEIFQFYRDLFSSFATKEEFIAAYDLNNDMVISTEEFPIP